MLSVRLDGETVRQLGEIADELDRSKASVLARAVREYVEREYAVLEGLRESDRDTAANRTVSNDELKDWLKDRRKGKQRDPKFRK